MTIPTTPPKPRKPTITNTEVISRLVKSKHWVSSDWKNKSSKFNKIFESGSNYNYYYNKLDTVYSYLIPVDIYKKNVSRYKVQFPVGTRVRLRTASSRKHERTSFSNDLGNTKNWGHVGIGSGKKYMSGKVKEIMEKEYGVNFKNKQYGTNWQIQSAKRRISYLFKQEILIGNIKYPANLVAAHNKANYFNSCGIKKPKVWARNSKFRTDDFLETFPINGSGIFGPKKLINGFITKVYVHFLYPKWKRKRESRYEVLFETGARGIFTNDYLKRVWDTDYDIDEKLMVGCTKQHNTGMHKCSFCTHTTVHLYESGCDNFCNYTDTICKSIFDYTDFMNTTCGEALDYASDENDV